LIFTYSSQISEYYHIFESLITYLCVMILSYILVTRHEPTMEACSFLYLFHVGASQTNTKRFNAFITWC